MVQQPFVFGGLGFLVAPFSDEEEPAFLAFALLIAPRISFAFD